MGKTLAPVSPDNYGQGYVLDNGTVLPWYLYAGMAAQAKARGQGENTISWLDHYGTSLLTQAAGEATPHDAADAWAASTQWGDTQSLIRRANGRASSFLGYQVPLPIRPVTPTPYLRNSTLTPAIDPTSPTAPPMDAGGGGGDGTAPITPPGPTAPPVPPGTVPAPPVPPEMLPPRLPPIRTPFSFLRRTRNVA